MSTTAMRKLLLWALALMTLMGLSAGVKAASDSAGTEFYFAFQQNNVSVVGDLSLFITSQQNTQGVVEIPGLNFSAAFTVLANTVTTVILPSVLPNDAKQLPHNMVSKLAVHVTAQHEVTVYGLNQKLFSTDAFLALPVDTLGLEYVAMSYVGLGSYGSQVAVVGVFDNTQVTITPAGETPGRPAGVPFTISLNRNETFQIRGTSFVVTSADLTGTTISATSPVAVMSGVECVNIPVGVGACDHIVEMMPPVTTWGKSFLTVPLATRLRGDVFRILASQDGTTVTINGSLVATLNRGKFYEAVVTSRSEIKTSAPALVAQYSPGQNFDGVISDPFMMLVPPTEQFLSQYTFSTPATGFTKNFVNVVIPSGAVSTLALDGVGVDPVLFSPIGASGFSGAQIPISLGSHTIAGNIPFGIYVYGFGFYDSYGYPGGMAFQFINPVGDPYPPNLRLIQIGDTLQGTATDSEDSNANGMLDAGEDLNGNGKIDRRSEDVNDNGILDPGEDLNANTILDRDTGIFKVELAPGAVNLKLDVLAFIPGALSVNFTISLVTPGVLGTGVLHIEDGAGNKIESPISFGVPLLQNVRVIDTLSTNNIDIDPASFSKAPYSITAVGDQTLIEWRFDSFPANLTEDLGFDVILKNPVSGENRLVSHKLELFYTDVNGKPIRTELGSQYVNVLPSAYQIGTVSDKLSYAANEPVLIVSTAKNLSAFPGSAAVRLSIKDANGVLVAPLGQLPAQAVLAGETKIFAGLNFNTGTILIGNYFVHAELVESNGMVTATASAPFSVVTSAAAAAVRLSTDKPVYNAWDTVEILALVQNTAPNAILAPTRAEITVKTPSGTTLNAATRSLGEIVPGGILVLTLNLPLSDAASGGYPVSLVLKDEFTRTPLTAASTSFQVQRQALQGLTGTVTVSVPQVYPGDPIHCTDIAKNISASDLAGVTLTHQIINMDRAVVVSQYAETINLPAGGTRAHEQNIDTRNLAVGGYTCVIRAEVNGATATLAFGGFRVVEPPIKIDAELKLGAKGRLLVLLDNPKACGNDDEQKDNGKKTAASSSPEPCKIADTDPYGPAAAPKLSAQRVFLEKLLKAEGWSYTITETAEDFTRAFHSGGYSLYALLAEREKLAETVQKELREAVFRGEGLLVAGVHDNRLNKLSPALGLRHIGQVSDAAGVAVSPGTLAPAGSFNLLSDDPALRVKRTTAQSLATYVPTGVSAGPISGDQDCRDTDAMSSKGSESENDECEGHPEKYLDAVTFNRYGSGLAAYTGFDLLATVTRDGETALAAKLLKALLGGVNPKTLNLLPDTGAPIDLTVTNRGMATPAQVTLTLPAGVTVLDPGTGSVTEANGVQPGTVTWTLNLGLQQTVTLPLWLRLPETPGPVTLNAKVEVTRAGVTKTYAEPSLTLNVIAVPTLDQLKKEARDVYMASPADRTRLSQILDRLDDALRASKLDRAIDEALKATDVLEGATGNTLNILRWKIDAWIREAAGRAHN